MTQEIIEMAREVGLCRTQSNFEDWIDAGPSGYELEVFAKLVAEREREACAKICDEFFKGNKNINYSDTIAICIRARGQE